MLRGYFYTGEQESIRSFEQFIWEGGFGDDPDPSFRMPTHKEVCSRCGGEGSHDPWEGPVEPEAFEDPGFDPSPVVDFNERVTRQDAEACERVQRGVTSRAFDHGVFPARDAWVFGFDERYRRDVEG